MEKLIKKMEIINKLRKQGKITAAEATERKANLLKENLETKEKEIKND